MNDIRVETQLKRERKMKKRERNREWNSREAISAKKWAENESEKGKKKFIEAKTEIFEAVKFMCAHCYGSKEWNFCSVWTNDGHLIFVCNENKRRIYYIDCGGRFVKNERLFFPTERKRCDNTRNYESRQQQPTQNHLCAQQICTPLTSAHE